MGVIQRGTDQRDLMDVVFRGQQPQKFMPTDEKLKTISRWYPTTGILLEKVCRKRDGADMPRAKKWSMVIH